MKHFNVFFSVLLALVLTWIVGPAIAADNISAAPPAAEAYIITPTDGQTVPNTFTIKFGLSGMGIAPAGVDAKNTGHHHLLIDVQDLPDVTTSLPSSDRIRHFGGGQTETSLTLPPGQHTLQLVLGNYLHIPHSPPVISDQVTITVGQS